MGKPEAAMRRVAFVALALMSLTACDYWFGERAAAPLPGKRISVLLQERTVAADKSVADQQISLPPPSVNPDWPQAGGYANHAMHHIEVGEVLERAWQADIGAGATSGERMVSAPIVADGRVFTLDAETTVSALDAATGRRLWATDLTPDDDDDGHIAGGIAFEDGRVFVATGFAQVIAVNAETGKPLWRQTVGGPMRSPPTVSGGRVFVITVDNKLYALDALNGTVLWTHSGIAEMASLLGGASPAVDGGVVVAPFSSGELVALRVENGRVLWADSLASARRTDAVSTLSHIRGRPVIDRGRVFAMSQGDRLVSIDLRSGRRIWDREIGGLESLWVAGNYVYALTNDAEVLSLSRSDGRVYWVSGLPRFADEKAKKDPIVWTGPILVSDRLVVAGSHGQALAVSPYNGKILGKVALPDGVPVAPVAANRSIFFLTQNAKLVAYR